jgi:hypothetical protein
VNAELFKTWFEEQFLQYFTKSVVLLLIMIAIVLLCCRNLLLQAEKAGIIGWLSTKYVQHTATDTRVELLQMARVYTSHMLKGTNRVALQEAQIAQAQVKS